MGGGGAEKLREQPDKRWNLGIFMFTIELEKVQQISDCVSPK